MSLKGLEEELKKSTELLTELIVITNKTRKTLTMVNIVNIVTLIVIAILMFIKI